MKKMYVEPKKEKGKDKEGSRKDMKIEMKMIKGKRGTKIMMKKGKKGC